MSDDQPVAKTRPTTAEGRNFEKRKRIPNSRLKEMAKNDELRLISLIMKDKECLRKAMSIPGLTWESFVNIREASAYKMITDYWNNFGARPTRKSLNSIIVANVGEEGAVPMMTALANYASTKVNPEDFNQLVKGIRDRDIRQKTYDIIRGGDLISEMLQDLTPGVDKFKKFAKDASMLAVDIQEYDGCSKVEWKSGSDMASSIKEYYLECRETDRSERNIMCGINGIDDLFNGFGRGKYGVITGMPNGGKTTMMFNFAINMAIADYKVGYVTIESSAKELINRLISRESRVPSSVVRHGTGHMTDEIMNRLFIAVDRMDSGWGRNISIIHVDVDTEITDILSLVDEEMQKNSLDVVFFDYLGVIRSSVRYPTRPDLELADVGKKILSWGNRNDVLTWTAAQIKNERIKHIRKNDDNTISRVGVEDIGGSQAISSDADYVLSLVKNDNKLTVYITKARDGTGADQHIDLIIDTDIGLVTDDNMFSSEPGGEAGGEITFAGTTNESNTR